ncbi:MAG: hypothetical protein ACYCST_04470 [Acidimicrobiales bacterium]
MNFRGRVRDDSGQALVLALVTSMLLVAAFTVAVASAVANLSFASQYDGTTNASLAAASGIDAAIASMRGDTSYASFPCALSAALSVPGMTDSSYSVTMQYSNGSTPLTCPGPGLGGTTPPTSAVLVSTGSAPHGSASADEAVLSIAAGGTAAPAALSYAIFTPNNVDLTNGDVIDQSGSNPAPGIYAGGTLTCDNGVLTEGSVVTYQSVDLTNNCTIGGALTSAGAVSMANSASVGGSLTSYGGGLTMTGSARIGGSATETSGDISLANSSTIVGSASSSGSISLSGTSSIGGTQVAYDAALTGETMPPPVPFPTVDANPNDYQSAGWTVIDVPTSSCAAYFYSYSSGASDPFMTAIASATTKTFVYAPTCAVTYENAHTFDLNADVVLDVASLTLGNSNTFTSTTSTVRDLSVLASTSSTCTTSTTDFSASNLVDFTSTVDAFIYTPGEVSYANSPSMSGQILACGGFVASNAFKLDFVPTPSSSSKLLWTESTSAKPTIAVRAKYVVRG